MTTDYPARRPGSTIPRPMQIPQAGRALRYCGSFPRRASPVRIGVEMPAKPPVRPTFTDLEALQFHSVGRPGKLEVVATKPMATQRDLSLAYSPGLAAAGRAI